MIERLWFSSTRRSLISLPRSIIFEHATESVTPWWYTYYCRSVDDKGQTSASKAPVLRQAELSKVEVDFFLLAQSQRRTLSFPARMTPGRRTQSFTSPSMPHFDIEKAR